MEQALRESTAVPAVTAVLSGTPTLGVLPDELERLLARDGVRKVSARDLPTCIAQGADGATTVSAALALARAAGVQVFATGGIGGVHRGAPYDESADLRELSRTPMMVVCTGAKSILDLPGTLERLESYGVTVIGFRTDELPGFFTASTGLRLPSRADSEREIADAFRAARALQLPGAMLVVQPPPAAHALERDVMEHAVEAALDQAARKGVTGAGVTPFLWRRWNDTHRVARSARISHFWRKTRRLPDGWRWNSRGAADTNSKEEMQGWLWGTSLRRFHERTALARTGLDFRTRENARGGEDHYCSLSRVDCQALNSACGEW
jgi:pseudouridine-5'-phosphate glycosidase